VKTGQTRTPPKLSNHGETLWTSFGMHQCLYDQTWYPPTSNPTLKIRRDTLNFIRTRLDPSSCPQSSPGETTTLPPSAMEPTSRIRLTAKDKEYYLYLQHISPPHSLWILYKAIEEDMAAAQYTRTEIREYISDLQSHNEHCPPRTSNKCLPTAGESVLPPKGHFFNESSRTVLTQLNPKERSTSYPRHIWKKRSLLTQAYGNRQRRRHSTHSRQSQTNLLANAAKGTNQDTPGRAQVQWTRKDEETSQSNQSPLLNLEPQFKP
jgi:hypothetical protein